GRHGYGRFLYGLSIEKDGPVDPACTRDCGLPPVHACEIALAIVDAVRIAVSAAFVGAVPEEDVLGADRHSDVWVPPMVVVSWPSGVALVEREAVGDLT